MVWAPHWASCPLCRQQDHLLRNCPTVGREEAAVDEAEMPAEEFHRKQAFKQQLQEQVRRIAPAAAQLAHETFSHTAQLWQFAVPDCCYTDEPVVGRHVLTCTTSPRHR